MPREPLISGDSLPDPDDESGDGQRKPDEGDDFYFSSKVNMGKLRDDEIALRPQHMNEMVGQRKVAERLHIAVDAARKRGEALGHILLDGPPGLGKTTFATCIPRDLDVPLQIASGAALSAPKDLLPYLTNDQEGSVLFIDEIDRLP